MSITSQLALHQHFQETLQACSKTLSVRENLEALRTWGKWKHLSLSTHLLQILHTRGNAKQVRKQESKVSFGKGSLNLLTSTARREHDVFRANQSFKNTDQTEKKISFPLLSIGARSLPNSLSMSLSVLLTPDKYPITYLLIEISAQVEVCASSFVRTQQIWTITINQKSVGRIIQKLLPSSFNPLLCSN